jgi:signal transduction histidine kinase
LSLVRETVEALGGRAWAEFEEGKSVFVFTMPCRRRAEAVAPPKPDTTSRSRSAVG